MTVILSAQAWAGVRAVAREIAQRNKIRAYSFVIEFQDKLREIAADPHAFPVTARYQGSEIRRANYARCLILYRVQPAGITVVTFLEDTDDYDRLLFPI
ncbi:type II toxin-antitoxin system RelE/ParE family toxin [Oleomonas cavernae]|uniref:Type II toxin-antitoxin system RelE/ParE family toxin n=1 Tax=Oleomonas cavernae TaxID=2320859 RepID=A0A418WDK9_9PROT|nr:type II toxin-antitoxin system RelE/ParE family toxin [Oleomonas cavernae]RJF88123.1 type II toxin-antitoxin system RelE/ParE family toxin [Oleomonas cavernae]